MEDTGHYVQSAFNAVKNLVNAGTEKGWLASVLISGMVRACKNHPPSASRTKRVEKAPRRGILDQASNDRRLEDGRWTPLKQAPCGLRPQGVSLIGQMVVNQEMDEESRCKECQMAFKACATVEQDRFWVRTQRVIVCSGSAHVVWSADRARGCE